MSGINDYSSKRGGGIRIVIDLKRDANPQVILNQLYQMTQLQISYGIIQLALVDGVPKILTLKEIIEQYIKFQCEIITRRTEFDLKKHRTENTFLQVLKEQLILLTRLLLQFELVRAVRRRQSRLLWTSLTLTSRRQMR